MTPSSGSPRGRHAMVCAVVLIALVAWVIPTTAPVVQAVTEYRYELVPTTPTPLDYKGVSWAPDGSEAMIVGGVQAVVRYDPVMGSTSSVTGGNWSTTSQLLEDVDYTPASVPVISGGRLEDTDIHGDLWYISGSSVSKLTTMEGDILEGVAVSPVGALLAVGMLGSVYELANGTLVEVGRVGDVPLYDLAWSPDGSGAFMVGAAGTVAWFDGTEGIVVEIDFTSTHPLHSISWRPGTDTAWAVGEGGLVVELNSTTLDASRVRPYSPRDEDLYGVAWHPNGELALVVGQEGVTYLWRLGVFTRQLVDVGWDLLDAEWNPVGDEALVVGQDGSLLRFAPRVPTQNQPPNAIITSPTDGAEYEADGTIRLDGSTSSDPEDDDLTFTWTSNQSGILGSEPVLHVGLPIGDHLITLHVDDGQGHNVTDQVRISLVRPVPPEERVHIDVVTPRPGSLLSGDTVISGTASYERGDIASVELAMDEGGWRPAEGTSSWSLTLDTTLFLDGIHTLTVRAMASDGVSRTEDLLVEIRNAVVPEPPLIPNVTLRISESGIVDELLSFEAEAEDLSPWILVWTFGDGSNAQGTHVNHAYAEDGTYRVSLELWLEGSEEPAAVFTATVIIKKASEVGQPIEKILIVAVIAAAVIYVAGFYGGRRAFRRD